MDKRSGSGSGSGINNPDHISDILETIFWVKLRKFFYAVPGIRDGKSSELRDLG
jgi:hypothetical protein